MESVSSIIGAIMLVESLISVLDKNRMNAFEHLSERLKAVCDFFVAKFIEARDQIRSQGQTEASLEQMNSSLEVLLAWGRMHERQLEFTVEKNYLMKRFANSDSFAASLIGLLTLSADFQPGGAQTSIIARSSGIPKLDNQLNLVKVKALDCILSLIKYIYEQLLEEDQAKACPLISYLRNTITDLMNSAVTFAASPDFEAITEDNETLAELMTSLLSLLT